MTSNAECRRASARCKLSYPVRLHIPGEGQWVSATTSDVSSDGFYCTSASPFRPHSELDCEIVIPTEGVVSPPPAHTAHSQLVLRCRVQVVRLVAKGLDPGYGMACRIERYNVDEQNSFRVAEDWHGTHALETA
jgi:hypothetical protein